MRIVGLLLIASLFTASAVAQRFAGTLQLTSKAQSGYTLFSSISGKNTYLINNCGNVINSWESAYGSANCSYLMKNGNLVRAVTIPNTVISRAGGGGAIEMHDWDGNLIWTYTHNSTTVRQHHDITPLDNGNILLFAWQVKTLDESIAAGRDPNIIIEGSIWSEEIIEVKPVFPNGFEIVWRWDLWDHLIQDFDATKPNYGVVSEHPELVNVNYTEGMGPRDWVHLNAIDYNAELDQIMVTTPFFDEIWIIDHSTTTAQAKTHSGGRSNKGGDLLFRWGNPLTYKKGTAADQLLGGPHHGHWVKKGLPNEGKILVYNNVKGVDYSAGDVITPSMNSNGTYNLENGRFLPAAASTTYKANPPQKLFSNIMSGVEILPNGNVLFCPSLQGRFIELTPELDTAWLYKSPISQANGIAGRDFTPTNANFTNDPSFRATKYPLDYPAFTGKNLTPGEAIEGGMTLCEVIAAVDAEPGFDGKVYPNPVNDYLYVESPDEKEKLDVMLLDVFGRELARQSGIGKVRMATGYLPGGIFITKVNGKSVKVLKH